MILPPTLFELLPLIAAGVAVAVVIAIPVLRRKVPRARRLPRSSRPDSAARLVVGVGAAALILFTVPVVMQSVYYSLGFSFGDYLWWRYAEALILACVVVLAVAILLARYRRRPEEPVAPTHPRTWRSFTTGSQLWLLSISVFALFLVVTFAGSVSSTDPDGHYRELEIETGTAAPSSAMAGFFGWAYGLPVAAVTTVLVALTITTLHLNAARPFLKSATVRDEEASRSALSALLVWFTVGAVLLTLSSAMRNVSMAAGLSFHMEGYSWETTIAELAPWLYWVALFMQFAAHVVLGLVIAGALLRPIPSTPSIRPTPGGADATQSTAQRSGTHG